MRLAKSYWLPILLLAVGLAADSARAQETMRVAIPLFPTAAFPLLFANDRGFFRNEGLAAEVLDFAYQYLHVNSEATLYPPEDAVKNLIRMAGYMGKKLASISANRVMDLSILDELGTKKK